MNKGGSAPDSPDYSGLIDTATTGANSDFALSKEQQDWGRDQYAKDQVVLNNVINPAISRQTANDTNATTDRARYENTFVPLQDEFIKTAKDYASPERTSLEMGKAQSTVAQNFDGQRNAALQSLEGYGVDPSSTRFAALDAQTRIAQAAAAAGAGNTARDQTQNTALALQKAAIDMGVPLPGQIASEYATSNQSGGLAANTKLAGTESGAKTMGTGLDWTNAGNTALTTAGDLKHADYGDKSAQYTADQNSSSGLGSLAGMIGGAEMPTGADGSGGGSFLGSLGSMAMKAAPFLLADGGAIPPSPGATPGGNIPPSASPTGGQATDDVDAKLTVGEFVIPKDVMAWYGEQHFQKLIEKARAAQPQAPAQPKVGMAQVGNPAFVSRPQNAGAIPVR